MENCWGAACGLSGHWDSSGLRVKQMQDRIASSNTSISRRPLEGAWDFCQSTRHTYALLPNVYASGSLLCVVGWTFVGAMHESLGLLCLVGDVRHCTQMCAQKS